MCTLAKKTQRHFVDRAGTSCTTAILVRKQQNIISVGRCWRRSLKHPLPIYVSKPLCCATSSSESFASTCLPRTYISQNSALVFVKRHCLTYLYAESLLCCPQTNCTLIDAYWFRKTKVPIFAICSINGRHTQAKCSSAESAQGSHFWHVMLVSR